MVTQEELRRIFDYDPEGWLIWKVIPYGDGRIGQRAGNPSPDGYHQVGWKGRRYKLHKLIYLYHTGNYPDLLDHIDRDRGNSRIENLRPTNRSQNAANSVSTRSNTGVRGVTFSEKRQKFIAQITKDYKCINLGRFDTLKEASEVYQKAREEMFPGVFIDCT